MARKIVENVAENVLQQDLEKYLKKAFELGAADARIITPDQVVIDERVRVKCVYPKCEFYGTNANCPPYAMPLEDTRKLISKYRYALFFRLRLPTELQAGKRTLEQLKETHRYRKKKSEIVGKIEAEAFYDGYYLAVGFDGGTCKSFCLNEDCRVLRGQSCKVPLRSRSSMEAVGMDVFLMATKLGWDIYPLGGAPSDAPCGTMAGIIFIY